MKRKKTDWSKVPWTEWQKCELPTDQLNRMDPPQAIFRNSRYQVVCYLRDSGEPFGTIAHLSFKVHDKQPHHDWRDMQRIKNEICGPECDAVEIFPAESKMVDAANQYHLFVFQKYRLPFGFQTRLVADGTWGKSIQRPFERGERPADCLDAVQYSALINAQLGRGDSDNVQAEDGEGAAETTG